MNTRCYALMQRCTARCLAMNVRSLTSHSQPGEKLKVKTLNGSLDRPVGQPSWVSHSHLLRDGDIIPGMDKYMFAGRRQKAMGKYVSAMHKKGGGGDADVYVIIVPSASTSYSAPDVPHPFRQDSNMLYLCGYQEPDSILVLICQNNNIDDMTSLLVVGERTAHKELWEGPQSGPDGAMLLTGVDAAVVHSGMLQFMDQEMGSGKILICAPPKSHSPGEVNSVLESLTLRHNVIMAPLQPKHLVEKLRFIKCEAEIELLGRVAKVGSESLGSTMNTTKVDMLEHVLMNHYQWQCSTRGIPSLAYPPVVAGGPRANIIHYLRADQRLKDGELVLMDAGCEQFGYVCDITRTWPVGKTSDIQRSTWEALMHIHRELVEYAGDTRPITLNMIYHRMIALICKTLVELGAVDSSVEGSKLKALATDVCPHHVSHYLGMDVHDCSSISRDAPLVPGVYFTIEPGLYFQTEDTAFRAEFRGMGMRVEDDIILQEGGLKNLTAMCPYFV